MAAFGNGKLEDLRFATENGADVSVCGTKTTVLSTSLLYRIVFILSSYLLGKRMSVKLTERNDENRLHISAEVCNLEGRKVFFFLKEYCFEKR